MTYKTEKDGVKYEKKILIFKLNDIGLRKLHNSHVHLLKIGKISKAKKNYFIALYSNKDITPKEESNIYAHLYVISRFRVARPMSDLGMCQSQIWFT